nr:hypothetical protein [Paenibacillus larvae]
MAHRHDPNEKVIYVGDSRILKKLAGLIQEITQRTRANRKRSFLTFY